MTSDTMHAPLTIKKASAPRIRFKCLDSSRAPNRYLQITNTVEYTGEVASMTASEDARRNVQTQLSTRMRHVWLMLYNVSSPMY